MKNLTTMNSVNSLDIKTKDVEIDATGKSADRLVTGLLGIACIAVGGYVKNPVAKGLLFGAGIIMLVSVTFKS